MKKFLYYITIILGIISSAFFVIDYFIFYQLRPKMVTFELITKGEENLLLFVGVGLLVFLLFYLLSLFKIASYLKRAKRITAPLVLLTTVGVLAFLFVFSDFALLTDIDKQYRLGLAQPEWSLVYPIMMFQFIMAIIFTYLHLYGFKPDNQIKDVAKDHNVFLVAQYIGLICGLLGLVFTSLGFVFHRAWNLHLHTTISSIILLLPYVLIVVYWFFMKFKEESGDLYDEKQIQDVGKSAFVTMAMSVFFMILLFVFNYNNLDGMVRVLWLPFYLFSTLFIFSATNLYYLKRG